MLKRLFCLCSLALLISCGKIEYQPVTGKAHHGPNGYDATQVVSEQVVAATQAAGLAPGQIVLFELGETGMWRPEIPEAIKNRGKTRDNPMRQWRKGEARPM